MRSHWKSPRRLSAQSGQTFVFIIIFIAIFLIGVLGIATDFTQIWARRQMTQAAADAACQAGAADLFLQYQNPDAPDAYPVVSFSWIGTAYDCSSNTTSPPCLYAAKNGYSGSKVSVTFPTSLTTVGAPSGFGTIAHPFIRVKVTDTVQLSFTRIVSHNGTFDVSASAGCGLNPVAVPIPLVILHRTASNALNMNGGPTIQIYGGPNRSIQVDSDNTAAVANTGSFSIDLSQAGPSNTGADFGVFGNESKPSQVNVGATGKWVSPSLPLGDPWITVATPSVPDTLGTTVPVAFEINGCPDTNGCVEFSGGNYAGTGTSACKTGTITYLNVNSPPTACTILPVTININDRSGKQQPYNTLGEVILPSKNNPGGYAFKVTTTGTTANLANNSFPATPPWNQTVNNTQTDGTVVWTNIGKLPSGAVKTAIFDPGLYYLGAEGLQLTVTGTTARPSTATGDGNSGTTFYFSSNAGTGQNKGTINVGASSGSATPCTSTTLTNCVVSYRPDGGPESRFSLASAPLQCPSGTSVPSQVPSTVDGNILIGPCSGTYGSTDHKDRGFLFYQSRSTAVSASWSGSGQFLLSGFMYFHNTSYGSDLTLSGNSSSGAFTLGNIVADKITLGGTSGLKMILNPASTFQVLKPQLLE